MSIIRVLSYVIDLIIVYIPSYFIVGMIPQYSLWAGTFSILLFFVYNVVVLENFNKQTIGKYFGQLQVVSKNNNFNKFDLNIIIRELSKSIYLLPGIIGITGLILSACIYLLNKTTLHDWLAQTSVCFIKKGEQHGE